jgi:hypothetical protein
MIAGDDDHKLKNNPGRVKALEAALAAHGMVVFPNPTAAQREKGLTDFNDLALENPRLAKHQLDEAVWRVRQQSEEHTGELGKGCCGWIAGRKGCWPKPRLNWVIVPMSEPYERGRKRCLASVSIVNTK